MSKLYRVIVKTTSSMQPDTTFWHSEVIYCGNDREQARIAFHRNEPEDYSSGFGNAARMTVSHVIKDAESADFEDDPVSGFLE